MNGIIIYKGKYGATKQYAEWLSAALKFPAVSADECSGKLLNRYDFLVLGSSVYVGKLQLTRWMEQNQDWIGDKKIFFFQVAAAPPTDKAKRESFNKGIPETIFHNCSFYYLPGKMVMKELSRWDRFMLKMGARMTKDPKAKKDMVTDFNHISRDRINEMLSDISDYAKIPSPMTFEMSEWPWS